MKSTILTALVALLISFTNIGFAQNEAKQEKDCCKKKMECCEKKEACCKQGDKECCQKSEACCKEKKACCSDSKKTGKTKKDKTSKKVEGESLAPNPKKEVKQTRSVFGKRYTCMA